MESLDAIAGSAADAKAKAAEYKEFLNKAVAASDIEACNKFVEHGAPCGRAKR